MPGIASRPSTDVNGPCSWRKAMIFSAVEERTLGWRRGREALFACFPKAQRD
jgi:hypothetical protein